MQELFTIKQRVCVRFGSNEEKKKNSFHASREKDIHININNNNLSDYLIRNYWYAM